jgi:choline kinase
MGTAGSSEKGGRQAVLLAAGMGSRLGAMTAHRPKCMTIVNGRTILERAVEALRAAGIGRIVLVTGYQHQVLADYVNSIATGMEVVFVRNEDYAKTNNIYSLWLAKEAISSDFILLESDILFTGKMISDLYPPCAASVSPFRDWMDGTVVTLAPDRGIVAGMYLKNDPKPDRELYKTVNLYSFSRDAWEQVVWPRLDRAVREGNVGTYYETVFAEALRANQLALRAAVCGEEDWHEIDTAEDLAMAASKPIAHQAAGAGAADMRDRASPRDIGGRGASKRGI